MSDIFTVSDGTKISGKTDIFYGLTILLYLAAAFYKQSVHLSSISVKHNFPLTELEPIVFKLEKAGLLKRDSENRDRLMLSGVPEGRWIFEVIPELKTALRGG